jgi:hypothetical protein
MKLLSILLTIALLSIGSFGQSLSKQDVLDLKKAGVDKTVMIQQIQKDGINFEMNAATTIELKNLGFSDDVLSALLSSKTSVMRLRSRVLLQPNSRADTSPDGCPRQYGGQRRQEANLPNFLSRQVSSRRHSPGVSAFVGVHCQGR